MTQNCNCQGSGGQDSQTVAAILERPRYSPGLILEDSDLTSAVDYTQALSRLLFRNLFGCGVICGLTVTVDPECGLAVTVSPGLALDGCGDPVQIPSPVTIAYDKKKAEQFTSAGTPLWVTLCGKEKLCQPRALVCEADDYDGVTQATRIRAMSEVSILFEKPECVCGCSPPVKPAAAPAAGAANQPQDVWPSDPCHEEHQFRADCAEDCGCGSACDCGCCVLLATVELVNGVWTPRHKGVRRLVRAALVPDREPGTPVTPRPAEPAPAPPKTAERNVEPPPPPPDPKPVQPEEKVGDAVTASTEAVTAAAEAAAAAATPPPVTPA